MPNPILNAFAAGYGQGERQREAGRKRRIDEILGKYFTPAGTERLTATVQLE